jgi:hypothetical protein
LIDLKHITRREYYTGRRSGLAFQLICIEDTLTFVHLFLADAGAAAGMNNNTIVLKDYSFMISREAALY